MTGSAEQTPLSLTMPSTAAGKSSLKDVKCYMARLRQPSRPTRLSLSLLRLDRACMECMAEHYEEKKLSNSPQQQENQPFEIYLDNSRYSPGSLGEEGMGRLVRAVEDQLKSIQIVDRKTLSSSQASDLFSSLQYAKNSEKLCLRGMSLVVHGVGSSVAAAMQNMLLKQASLTSLTISQCEIDQTVMETFAAALPHMPSLRVFTMQICALTGNQDTMHAQLIESLISSSSQQLELRSIIGTSASSLLVSRLLREKPNLVVLDLSSTPGIFEHLTEAQASNLASALVAAPRLKKLLLNECPSVGSVFVSAIFRALELRDPQPLEELSLMGCQSSSSVDWITTSLPHIRGLRVLFMPHNLVLSPVMAALLRALEKNTSLWEVYGGQGRRQQRLPKVQRALTRNRLLHKVTCAVETGVQESLWPRALKRLVRVEMSPVFVFLRGLYPTYAAETPAEAEAIA